MSRLLIVTIGKTHSGKTTFAKSLEERLSDSLVIDQDNHGEFLSKYYRSLLPRDGPNTIKYAITQTILEYAVHRTDLHLILCNANRSRKGREKLLAPLRNKGFLLVFVHFDLPDTILEERVAASGRSLDALRMASTFQEVLLRQQAEDHLPDRSAPADDEADVLFRIRHPGETEQVLERIAALQAQGR